jgi:hypothetical protein
LLRFWDAWNRPGMGEVISGYVFDNHVNAFAIGELMHFRNKVLLALINRNVGA